MILHLEIGVIIDKSIFKFNDFILRKLAIKIYLFSFLYFKA